MSVSRATDIFYIRLPANNINIVFGTNSHRVRIALTRWALPAHQDGIISADSRSTSGNIVNSINTFRNSFTRFNSTCTPPGPPLDPFPPKVYDKYDCLNGLSIKSKLDGQTAQALRPQLCAGFPNPPGFILIPTGPYKLISRSLPVPISLYRLAKV